MKQPIRVKSIAIFCNTESFYFPLMIDDVVEVGSVNEEGRGNARGMDAGGRRGEP